jgi:hypothetical protein
MIAPLLLGFTLLCVLLLLQGMLRRGGMYQYPFLAGAVFTGFVLPQLVGLSHDPFLPPGSLEATLIMATLSAAMCWLGSAMASQPARDSYWPIDDRRLLAAGVVLSLLGTYFFYAISRLPPEMTTLSSQWTGLPVAYLFFARMLTYGFAIGVLLAIRNRSWPAILLTLYGAAFYAQSIVIGGRRQDLVEFCTIILMAWWFQRNRSLPRPIMLGGLVLGTLFINSIGDYRAATMSEQGPQWSRVFNIDFVGNLERLSESGGAEVRNAVYAIAGVRRSMDLDLGASQWDALVFAYVPAQLVGADAKEALYIPVQSPAYDEYAYTPASGSTWTGLSDAFQSFWYFGCLEFFLISWIMQRLWLAAGGGSICAQLIYMLIPVQAMQAITHTTSYFVTPWIHIGIFLVPALWAARRTEIRPGSTMPGGKGRPLWGRLRDRRLADRWASRGRPRGAADLTCTS